MRDKRRDEKAGVKSYMLFLIPAFVIIMIFNNITPPAIINPISSAITANIKSVVLGYKYPN